MAYETENYCKTLKMATYSHLSCLFELLFLQGKGARQ